MPTSCDLVACCSRVAYNPPSSLIECTVPRFVRPNFPDRFSYLVVDVADDSSENIISHFPDVREYIDQALDAGGKLLRPVMHQLGLFGWLTKQDSGKILMHGNAGISRSGALLIAYLMYKLQTSYA